MGTEFVIKGQWRVACSLINTLQISLFFSTLSHHNYPWFAQFFESQILQINLNFQSDETDPTLRHLANPERLRKLHQRFAAQSPSSSNSTNQSSSNEAFYFKFLEIGNNYSLNSHLISILSGRLLTMSQLLYDKESQATFLQKAQSFTKYLIQLKLLGKVSFFYIIFFLIYQVLGIFVVLAKQFDILFDV